MAQSSTSKVAVVLLLLLSLAAALSAAHEMENVASLTVEPSAKLSSEVLVVSDAFSSAGIEKFLEYIKRSADVVEEVAAEICKKAESCPCRDGSFVCRACCSIKRQVPPPRAPANRLKIHQFIQNCKRFRTECQQPLGEICRRAAIGCPCRAGNDLKCLVCCGIRG
uniref:Cysteine-rich rehydration-responsive 1 n=1 Tax=Craterostigma plantagineum TaxID=4153 RepID=A0A097HTP3_CRAPL|nr:cysteine-rich rehydration-responsive 1 [Craterostigma plantagineum]